MSQTTAGLMEKDLVNRQGRQSSTEGARSDALNYRTAYVNYSFAIALLAVALFSRVATGLGAPSILKFAHFGLAVGFVVLIAPSIRNVISLRLVIGMSALLCAICLSAFVGGAGLINALLDFLLLAEPFLLLLIMIDVPFPEEKRRRFKIILMTFAFVHIALAYFQYAVMDYGHPDEIRGVFIGQGAGAHVGGGVAMATAAYVLAARSGLSLRLRVCAASIAGAVVIFTDSKQVIFAALVSVAVLGLTKVKSPRRALGYLALSALAAGGLYIAAQNVWPALKPGTSLERLLQGLEHKASILSLTTSHYKSPANWLVGLGPGHTVGRLGLLFPDYERYLKPLGATVSPVTQAAVSANYASQLAQPGTGSSFWSINSSWAGIWGDLGLLGLTVVIALWLIVWRSVCVDDLSRFLVLNVLVLSLLYPWMEEPGYMLFVSALIGLNWQEKQGQRSRYDYADGGPEGTLAPEGELVL